MAALESVGPAESFSSRIPITSQPEPLMSTRSPIGSAVSNRSSAVLEPSTATFAWSSTWSAVRAAPRAMGELVAANQVGVVPVTVTVALVLPYATVVAAEATGETVSTSGAVCASSRASATSRVRAWVAVWVAFVPRPAFADTVRVFVPRDCRRSWMATDEPLPTATSRITAPTPIMIPSIVSAERIRLLLRPWAAARRMSRALMRRHLWLRCPR